MQSERLHLPDRQAWRGAILIACVYVYFLIFAQFGFLKRLETVGITGDALRPIMGAMAVGGILASLLAARLSPRRAGMALRLALAGCAIASAASLPFFHTAGALAISLLIGASLGSLTVTLVANLPLWTGTVHPLLSAGLGTGIGYCICNVPAIFTASPQAIAVCAIAACFCALAVSAPRWQDPSLLESTSIAPLPFPVILAWLTALVWFDSAAFFIIQNSPALKSGAWVGTAHLWRTGLVHLGGALLSVWLLTRRGAAFTLVCAFACLACASLLLLSPAAGLPAAILYPSGVSLYSVVLVVYPSLFLAGSHQERARQAGWMYAIAGWAGSALGIGMAQHLHRIPLWFVAAAGLLFAVPLAWRYGRRMGQEALAFALVLLTAWALENLLSYHAQNATRASSAAAATPVERGRRVYIAEGCINCHSQYVRPDSPDVAMWGSPGDVEVIRHEIPPLIGNRRQGADLSNVGTRRSPLWLRIHLIDPRSLSYGSIMPSYSYLFRDRRGDDLVAYLQSLRNPGSERHLGEEIAVWHPTPAVPGESRTAEGAQLFGEFCATCHDPNGEVRRRWGDHFRVPPPNLASGHLPSLAGSESQAALRLRLARIIHFGIPGTDMPGHEYLPDAQTEALVDYVLKLRATSR